MAATTPSSKTDVPIQNALLRPRSRNSRPATRRTAEAALMALTPSERRVARMAAEGMANKEIAQDLFVTVKAVEVHLSSVYRKLQIKSRTQLADAIRGLR
jgi:DNA-binding NarL/FixJ family response regulator